MKHQYAFTIIVKACQMYKSRLEKENVFSQSVSDNEKSLFLCKKQ